MILVKVPLVLRYVIDYAGGELISHDSLSKRRLLTMVEDRLHN